MFVRDEESVEQLLRLLDEFKLISGQEINTSSYCVIVRVRVVLKRTVVGDCRSDNLSGSHLSHNTNY